MLCFFHFSTISFYVVRSRNNNLSISDDVIINSIFFFELPFQQKTKKKTEPISTKRAFVIDNWAYWNTVHLFLYISFSLKMFIWFVWCISIQQNHYYLKLKLFRLGSSFPVKCTGNFMLVYIFVCIVSYVIIWFCKVLVWFSFSFGSVTISFRCFFFFSFGLYSNVYILSFVIH